MNVFVLSAGSISHRSVKKVRLGFLMEPQTFR